MMLWIVAVLSVVVAAYVLGGRTWLISRSWMQWFYRSRVVDWVELHLFKKSTSVLWGRFLQTIGYGLSAVAGLGGIDLSPLAAVLPDRLNWIVSLLPLLISLAGHVQVQLRLDTTSPIELVAVSNDVADKAAPAMEQAAAAKLDAVAAVQEIKKNVGATT